MGQGRGQVIRRLTGTWLIERTPRPRGDFQVPNQPVSYASGHTPAAGTRATAWAPSRCNLKMRRYRGFLQMGGVRVHVHVRILYHLVSG